MNGRPRTKLFKRFAAYVTQDDALPGFYTVRETLQFYADLKLPSSVSKQERKVGFVLPICVTLAGRQEGLIAWDLDSDGYRR